MMSKISVEIAFVGVALVLSGCASVPTVATNVYVPPVKVVTIPDLNVDAEAEIGQTIISAANLSSNSVAVLASDVSEFKKAELLNNRWSGTTTLRAGTMTKFAENAEGSFFKNDGATFKIPTGSTPCQCGVFVPNDRSKPVVIYNYRVEIGATGYDFGMQPVAVTLKTVESWVYNSFKRELIYGGVSGNTVSISYREFSDGTARPAFTQDLKYDLSESKIIGYRGARFEVAKASNTVLKYKVLKPLD